MGRLQDLLVKIALDSSEIDKGSAATLGKIQGLGRRLSGIGSQLSLAVTAPLVGLGALASRASMQWEVAMAGVAKTTDASESEISALGRRLTQLSEKEIPRTSSELARLAEEGAQLGVATGNLEGFVRTAAGLQASTDLAEEAGSSIAQLANIMGSSQDEYDEYGSTIVELGNKLVTTERRIVDMALRLSGAGRVVGMSEGQVLGLSAAISSLGIEAEMGGTAFTRVLSDMASASGEKLDAIGKVADMSGAKFREAFQRDAAGALTKFIEGLARAQANGQNLFKLLDDLGFSEARVSQSLQRAAGGAKLFGQSLEIGTRAWKENKALAQETERFYSTNASALQRLKNMLSNTAAEFGDVLVPSMIAGLEAGEPLFALLRAGIHLFSELPGPIQKLAVAIGGIAVAAGPAVWVGGQLLQTYAGVSLALRGLPALVTAVNAAMVGTEAAAGGAAAAVGAAGATGAITGLGAVLATGGVIAGVGLLAAALTMLSSRADEAHRDLVKLKATVGTMNFEEVLSERTSWETRGRALNANIAQANSRIASGAVDETDAQLLRQQIAQWQADLGAVREAIIELNRRREQVGGGNRLNQFKKSLGSMDLAQANQTLAELTARGRIIGANGADPIELGMIRAQIMALNARIRELEAAPRGGGGGAKHDLERNTSNMVFLLNALDDARAEVAGLDFKLWQESDPEKLKTLNEQLVAAKNNLAHLQAQAAKWGGPGGESMIEFELAGGLAPRPVGEIQYPNVSLDRRAISSRGPMTPPAPPAPTPPPGFWKQLEDGFTSPFKKIGETLNARSIGQGVGNWIGQGAMGLASKALGSIVGKVFGSGQESPEELARRAVLKENTGAIQRLSEGVARLGTSLLSERGGDVSGIQSAYTSARGALSEYLSTWRPGQGQTPGAFFNETLNRELAKLGLTMKDAERIALGFNITLDGTIATWAQLMEAMKTAALDQIFAQYSGQRGLAQLRANIFDQKPEQQLEGLRDLMVQFTNIDDAFLKGLDLSSKEGQAAFDAWIKKTFEAFSADPSSFWEKLQGISPDDFLELLGSTDSLLDSFEQLAGGVNSVSASLRNVPTGFKLALRSFQADAGTVPVVSSDGEPRTRPGTGRATNQTIDNSMNVQTLNINVDSAESGDKIWEKVQKGRERASRRGGPTGFYKNTMGRSQE